MKFNYIIFLILPLSCYTFPSSEKPIAVLEENDLVAKESQISKRSGGGGSFDFLAHLKSGLFGSISKASGSLSSGSSGSTEYKSHSSYGHANAVDFDPWSLKKSVLNTIFQAVKAITGGVTAIKGQLIKGSGYALAAGGNLVAASGDKVTDVGKAIVHSAQLIPPSHGHSGGGGGPFAKFSSLSGASSGSSSSSGHPSPPEIHGETVETYEIPSGPAHHTNYGPPPKPFNVHVGGHGSGSYNSAPYHGAAAYEGPDNYNEYQGHTGRKNGGYKNNNINKHESTYPLTKIETEKATIALKEIIHLLPMTKTATKTYTATTTSSGGNSIGHANQLSSGSDLINQHNNNNHIQNTKDSFNLSPIETYAISQTLTTAYGLPKEFDPNNTGIDSVTSKTYNTNYQTYNSNTNTNSNQLSNSISNSNSNSNYNSHPYDLYHTMSNKYKTQEKELFQSYQSENHNKNYESHQSNNNFNNYNYNSDSDSSGSNTKFNTYGTTGISNSGSYLGPMNFIKPDNADSSSYSNSLSNSIAPIIVALGATNNIERQIDNNNNNNNNNYKIDNLNPNNNLHSQYDPERAKDYLRQLNPHIFPSITEKLPFLQNDQLQSASSQIWQNSIPNIQTKYPIHPISQPVTARNDRFNGKFLHKIRRPYTHHNKIKGAKELLHNSLGNKQSVGTTGHGFNGQYFYTY